MSGSSTALAEPSVCGQAGYLAPVTWSTPEAARNLASQLLEIPSLANVTANPHFTESWARQLVTYTPLLESVCDLIGPEVAVENTYLMVKRPGDGFAVPPHQDGINDRMELDPARSVAVWLAITEATTSNGCLEVQPGSQQRGYLPYRRADGGPLTVDIAGSAPYVPVELSPGQACVLDVRLVHRSGPNATTHARIGLNIRYVAPDAMHVRDGVTPPVLFPVTGDRW
jgi:ectoine hydroxylase-related dioxygenase (phytanoyl-CoA dioxygenase family)